MARPESFSHGSLTAAEFLALHRQIAALVKLGLPLERFLATWNVGGSRRWRRTVEQISSALQRGVPLEEALQDVEHDLAPTYRHLLQLGQKSGQLGTLLDDLAALSERILAIRNQLVLSLGYPLLIFLLAVGILSVFLTFVFPMLRELVISWNGTPGVVFAVLEMLRATVIWWAPICTAVTLGLFAWWVALCRGSRFLVSTAARARLGWFPGLRALLESQQVALFVKIVATAVKHRVPADQAVRLAGGILGDPAWSAEADRFAAAISAQDGSGALGPQNFRVIPASVRWTLFKGTNSAEVGPLIDSLAEQWWRHCTRQTHFLQCVVIPLVVVSTGTIVVLALAILLGLPWWQILWQLANVRI